MKDIDTPKRVIEDIKILMSQGCNDETLEARVSNFLEEKLVKNHGVSHHVITCNKCGSYDLKQLGKTMDITDC